MVWLNSRATGKDVPYQLHGKKTFSKSGDRFTAVVLIFFSFHFIN